DHEEEHDHDEDINSIELVLDQSFEPEALIQQLQELLLEQEIYRVKGFVNVAHKPMRLVLQGVGNRFDTFYDRLWTTDESRQTKLVLIGHELNRQTIESKLVKPKTLV
ncbi:MAG: GTP-binding protein, partial [Chroococcidiopsis sp.]